MGQIKLHSRQLLAEVFRLIDEDRTSSILIYDDNHFIGKISYNELIAFINYKKNVGDIYHHKLSFELGTVLHIIRGMRSQNIPVTPDFADKTLLVKFTSVAVFAVILLGVAWLFFKSVDSVPDRQKRPIAEATIAADKAVLDLGNGERINISDARAGIVYKDPGMEIVKSGERQIEYHLKDQGKKVGTSLNHTITTPVGMQYQVVLSDGTKLWLNTASSVTFPASFVERSLRHLSLNGEAYFEVAHNEAQPFFVSAQDQEIKVLGTHFNVSAYENDSSIKTTLLEGVLRVTAKAAKQSVLLKPGEQSVLTKSKLSVNKVAAQEFTAWKSGEFIFRNTPLEDIMRVVERQYGVKVTYYRADVKTFVLGGSILLSSKLNDVLNTLELLSNAQFKVEGTRVTVL